MVVAAVLAAGSGRRFGRDKVWEPLGGKPLWLVTLDRFVEHPLVDSTIVVCNPRRFNECRALAPSSIVVPGGATRQSSARAAVDACPGNTEILMLHDAARPFVRSEVIRNVLQAAQQHGAAAAACPVTDTIRNIMSSAIVNRSELVAMQTPQAATLELWKRAYDSAKTDFTDDIALLQEIGVTAELVPGDPENFKITVESDMERARAILGSVETRTGIGYDVHRFSSDPSRPLMLGGVGFPSPGLEGHSDADVILHAIVDSLLGAAALGDIGQHFPPSDERWRNEPSTTFLAHAARLLNESSWRVSNIDVAVIAEHPKIMPRSNEMREKIAACLGIEIERVAIKATTNEGLGSIGRGEGIAAFATATIRR